MKKINPAWLMIAILFLGTVFYTSGNLPMTIAAFAVICLAIVTYTIYIPYARNNPEHYWFKRKLYGWGWTPVTWQGWLTTLLYVGLVLLFALTIDEDSPAREVMFTFVLPLIFLTTAFLRIAYKKGESPRWQWGEKKD